MKKETLLAILRPKEWQEVTQKVKNLKRSNRETVTRHGEELLSILCFIPYLSPQVDWVWYASPHSEYITFINSTAKEFRVTREDLDLMGPETFLLFLLNKFRKGDQNEVD